MEPRRIPFITLTTAQCESSESDNDVEPRPRLFRKPRLKRDSLAGTAGAGGGGGAGGAPQLSTVSERARSDAVNSFR